MSISNSDLKIVADTVRTLSMDAIEKAKSGHPGMPMGCADIAAVLWTKVMRYNPDDPEWMNRDRFILSAGHGTMLLYSMLHFSGYDYSIEDIKKFRQLGSKTPGHPEFNVRLGIETTTGPLGQGFANGIGMALASKMLADEFNGDGEPIIDHYIYSIAGDGCIMEGITSEAAALAGHWGLGNIIYIYDSNSITIEGSTDMSMSHSVRTQFESYNWHVLEIDGHNFDEIEKALNEAKAVKDRPSLIIARTMIGKGSPNKQCSEACHGAPLGEDEVKCAKESIGCDGDVCFNVPERVYEIFSSVKQEQKACYDSWKKLFEGKVKGDIKRKWDSCFSALDAESLRGAMPEFKAGGKIATRTASGKVMEVLFEKLPHFIGGSADLGPSNKTFIAGYSESGRNTLGRNIHFGVREHAMGAIQNGIACYGGFIPFSATFFVFMDYMRPAVRMAALSHLQSIYVFSHDSFYVGEDGPTHQPVEHLSAARVIPNLNVIRPADASETVEAWISALKRTDGPTMLILTRQDVPSIDRKNSSAKDLEKGAYVIHDTEGNPDITILASGSEVHVSMEASEILAGQGIKARVVSFPSWYIFDKQDEAYRSSVIPEDVPVAVVEAGCRTGWERYAGCRALFITVDDYGISAPAEVLAGHLGMTSEAVAARIREYLKK